LDSDISMTAKRENIIRKGKYQMTVREIAQMERINRSIDEQRKRLSMYGTMQNIHATK
jgi:hypothetical protein